MSDRPPYPRDPRPGTTEGLLVSVHDLLRIVRFAFFPRTGANIMDRVSTLEARVKSLETQVRRLEGAP